MNIEDFLEPCPETEFDHYHSVDGSKIGYLPPSLHAEIKSEDLTVDDSYPFFPRASCQWTKSKIERFISRYIQYYRKPQSPDRTHMLEQLEAIARENNIRLPSPERIAAAKYEPKKRLIVEAVENNSAELRLYKVYSDGENIVGYIPGENKAKDRELHERTRWDDLFDTLYSYLKMLPENDEKNKSRAERESIRIRIISELIRQFYEVYGYDDKTEVEPCPIFIERKLYNMSAAYSMRKKRFFRKKDQIVWTAWWTFTYDDAIIASEDEFKSKLLNKFRNLAFRRGWRIMGVFEHGEDNGRLHFHGFVYIPEGTALGELVEKTQWSEKEHRQRTYLENTTFREEFGINEYEPLDYGTDTAALARYTSKMVGYMQKGGKVFYSRHIPSEFMLAVRDCDVVCAFSITCKRPIKRYLFYSDAYNKTDVGITGTIPVVSDIGPTFCNSDPPPTVQL